MDELWLFEEYSRRRISISCPKKIHGQIQDKLIDPFVPNMRSLTTSNNFTPRLHSSRCLIVSTGHPRVVLTVQKWNKHHYRILIGDGHTWSMGSTASDLLSRVQELEGFEGDVDS